MTDAPWKGTEVKTLRRVAAAGWTRPMAAEVLPGRTPGAVRRAASRFGITFKPRRECRRPYGRARA